MVPRGQAVVKRPLTRDDLGWLSMAVLCFAGLAWAVAAVVAP